MTSEARRTSGEVPATRVERAERYIEEGYGPFAVHQIEAVLDLHSPYRTTVTRCVAAGADYDYHSHVEACFQPAVVCNACGVVFTDCRTRQAVVDACPHAFDDGDEARPGDPCIWCSGEKAASDG